MRNFNNRYFMKKNEIQIINNGEYFACYVDDIKYITPKAEIIDNEYFYLYDVNIIRKDFRHLLIFKKIDDNTAIEIGSDIKFFIYNDDQLDINESCYVPDTKESFYKLNKEFKESPLIIPLSDCRKLNENDKLQYNKDTAYKFDILRNASEDAKGIYSDEEWSMIEEVYKIARVDDMIYECDKRYALKSDE